MCILYSRIHEIILERSCEYFFSFFFLTGPGWNTLARCRSRTQIDLLDSGCNRGMLSPAFPGYVPRNGKVRMANYRCRTYGERRRRSLEKRGVDEPPRLLNSTSSSSPFPFRGYVISKRARGLRRADQVRNSGKWARSAVADKLTATM